MIFILDIYNVHILPLIIKKNANIKKRLPLKIFILNMNFDKSIIELHFLLNEFIRRQL